QGGQSQGSARVSQRLRAGRGAVQCLPQGGREAVFEGARHPAGRYISRTEALIVALLAAGLTYVAPATPVRWTVTPPPAGWTAASFDDHGWTEATLPLVGDGRVDAGNPTLPPAQKIPGTAMTVYVRARFHVGAERLRSLALRARFAEGLVAWVDGAEIARRYVA